MDILGTLKHIAATTGRSVLRNVTRTAINEAEKKIRQSSRATTNSSATNFPGSNDRAVEYDIKRYGMPNFDYRPEDDGAPDPGEVVWTWVPYEENDGRGKDRPVLILAALDNHVIFAQMTSKDHDRDAAQEARWGRYWMDLGAGPWDSEGRPSELRLDRLLITHVSQIRREGARLDEQLYYQAVNKLRRMLG